MGSKQGFETEENSSTELKTCRSIVLEKETFLGYTWKSPERVSVGEEGESHSM